MKEQKSQDPHSFDQTCLSHEGIYTIPEGVTEIAEYGFSRQEGIISIEIPGSVKRIGNWTFADCKNLKHVTLHAGLEEIWQQAFRGSGLESIIIPGSVKIIGAWAFADCKNLKHVTLNEGLEEIGYGAFEGSGLEIINIPKSVMRMGDGAFRGCENLKNIIVEEGDVDRIQNLLPDEHKNKVILRKHYEKAQGMIQSIKVNEYTAPVMKSTKLPTDLAKMVGSYLNDEAYARMQAVPIPRTDDENAWNKYREALNNAATNSASSSSALHSSLLAGAAPSAPSSSSSSGGGGEGPDKGPGSCGCNIS